MIFAFEIKSVQLSIWYLTMCIIPLQRVNNKAIMLRKKFEYLINQYSVKAINYFLNVF
jgi:hypothetical protein